MSEDIKDGFNYGVIQGVSFEPLQPKFYYKGICVDDILHENSIMKKELEAIKSISVEDIQECLIDIGSGDILAQYAAKEIKNLIEGK